MLTIIAPLRGSHGLSDRRARRTKSSRPEGPQARSRGPEGPKTSSVIYFLKAMTNTKTLREHLQRAILETCVFAYCIFPKCIFPNIINLTGPSENCLKKWSCLLFQNTIFTEPARTLILLVIAVCKITCNIISIRLDWGRVSIQYNLVGEIFDGVTNFAMEIPCRG